jgi:hypothetical protein
MWFIEDIGAQGASTKTPRYICISLKDPPDPAYPSDHYMARMPSWLANTYTSLTETLTAMEKLVSESATRDHLEMAAFPGLNTQYRQLLQQ